MKTLLRLLPWLAFTLAPLVAAEDPTITAVRTVDDARVVASVAGDRAQLSALFSDALNYRHSSGLINDKATLIDHIAGGALKYRSMRYEDRAFTPAAPGIVLMTGHCWVQTESKGQTTNLHLSFLGVWRLEGDTWRFLAWQSCKMPAATS
jgi:hypothetical protein